MDVALRCHHCGESLPVDAPFVELDGVALPVCCSGCAAAARWIRDAGRGDYYRRTLSVTSIGGIGRLPEVTIPIAQINSVPVGLSLAAAQGEDMNLLEFVRKIVAERPI